MLLVGSSKLTDIQKLQVETILGILTKTIIEKLRNTYNIYVCAHDFEGINHD